MRTFTLIFFLFFCYTMGFPQANVTIGSPYGVVNSDQRYYFPKNGQILAIKAEHNRVVIQKLDAQTLALLQVRMYNDLPEDIMVEKVMKLNNKFYLFYSQSVEEKEQLFAREIDFESGAFRSAGRKIVDVGQKVDGRMLTGGPTAGKIVDKFRFYVPYDSSLVMIQYSAVPGKKQKDENRSFTGVHVFDIELNETWSYRPVTPSGKKMYDMDYSVDMAGNVYIVFRVYEDNAGKDVNYVEVMKVAAKTGRISKFEVKIPTRFVQTVRLYETSQNTMVGVGYYNTGNDPGSADGVLYFKVINDGVISNIKTYEIPLEIINQHVYEKEKRQNDKKEENDEAELSYLRLSDVKFQDDGSIVLIGEQAFLERVTASRSSMPMESYYYYDMLVTRIDPNGNLQWMKKLPKRQFSVIDGGINGGGVSYTYVYGKEAHYLVYFDDPKNANLPPDEVPATYTDGGEALFTAYKINNDTGYIKKITIFNTHHVDNRFEIFQLRTSRIVNIAPNTLVLESYKKKKEDILIKAELK